MRGTLNVFLIGPMGSGKTAVGRHVARVLGLPFYDSDTEIERRTGVDIAFIFEKEGELSKDELDRAEKELEKLTHEVIAEIDQLLGHKEQELLDD